MRKGFTIIEVMLVVVILAIALGFSLLYIESSQLRADLNTQTSVLVSYLRLNQSNAVSGRENQPDAIHLDTNSYTNFIGPTYNAATATNFTIDLPTTLTITNINLNGGGNNIVFNSPQGETTNYGSFELHSTPLNRSITININRLGNINY